MKLAVIMSGFPRRSETFALNELIALEEAGVLAAVFATKPGDGSAHPGVERIAHRVHMLAAGTADAQAAQVVDALADIPVTGIHAYFAHHPADVASLAAQTLGCRWGFSTHALDARKVPAPQLADRARAAATIVACNRDVAAEFDAIGANVSLIPHGVDIARFVPQPAVPQNGTLTVLAVGRLVEKKGFPVLVTAAALTRAPISVRIVGDGPLRDELTRQVRETGLDGRVTLTGPLTHAELPAAYAGVHVVAVPSIVNGEGDRDGLPNVVLEAMATARPVVASDVGAVASAITHDDTGMLVPAGDASALAAAFDRLAADPALRHRLADSGRRRVAETYELGACTGHLIAHLEGIYA